MGNILGFAVDAKPRRLHCPTSQYVSLIVTPSKDSNGSSVAISSDYNIHWSDWCPANAYRRARAFAADPRSWNQKKGLAECEVVFPEVSAPLVMVVSVSLLLTQVSGVKQTSSGNSSGRQKNWNLICGCRNNRYRHGCHSFPEQLVTKEYRDSCRTQRASLAKRGVSLRKLPLYLEG